MSAFFANPDAMILLTGLLVALAAALPGCFLVLRGSALMTDAISHAIVFGIALTWLVTGQISGPVQIAGAAAAGLLTVLLIEALTRTRRLHNDAAMGLVFPTLFAAGVLIINLYAREIHLDTDTVLLGEIGFVWLDTLPVAGLEIPQAVVNLSVFAALNLAYVLLFWKPLKLAVFDPDFAALQGLRPGAVLGGLFALTSATAVAAFDAVGAILFVAFVIVPAATAYLLTHSLALMVALAAGIGMASAFTGQVAAVALDVSIGGMMALMTGVFFALALVAAPRQGVIATLARRRAERLDFACRTLMTHLLAHADGPRVTEENAVSALETHLRWKRPEVRRVVLHALDRGLARREGEMLVATELGGAMGRDVVASVAPLIPKRGQDGPAV
ncbi:metal ABC transporter permease [Xinfangfangia pollutisoli]|uniref:metal ABC transporter permease n=1 Tax=Xinfangfangia pollutisoli TaxID=2865960 RepID=UPI001CD1EA55|nr:metal ABC transporter permease [Xinfangfangia pollutisoli]